MGTRADFYIRNSTGAEWLGSVALDGDDWWNDGNKCPLMAATTVDDYLACLLAIAAGRDDWTAPAEGWPWPWNDSRTTDYAYVFENGGVAVYSFGRLLCRNDDGTYSASVESDWFPDMSARKNVALGRRSGLIVFRA